MPIYRADIWEVERGRLQEFRDIVVDAQAAWRRMGSSSGNLIQMTVNSDTALRLYSTCEWENYATYGARFIDTGRNESEWQAILERVGAPDSPATHRGTLLLSEIGRYGERAEPKPGMVALVRALHVKPGSMNHLDSLVKDARPFVERCGGAGTMLYRNMVGGTFTGAVYTTTPFPTMQALGSYLDIIASDQQAQQLASRLLDPDSGITQVSVRIETVID